MDRLRRRWCGLRARDAEGVTVVGLEVEVEVEVQADIEGQVQGQVQGEVEVEVEVAAEVESEGSAIEEVRVAVVGGVEEGAVRTGIVAVEVEVSTARDARRAVISRRRAATSSRSKEFSSAVEREVVVVGGGGGEGSREGEEKSGAGTGAWTDRRGSGTEGTVTRTREGGPR